MQIVQDFLVFVGAVFNCLMWTIDKRFRSWLFMNRLDYYVTGEPIWVFNYDHWLDTVFSPVFIEPFNCHTMSKKKKVAKLCDTQMIIAHTCILQIQNYLENNTAEDICENSSKIIQFIDVPGHQKYLKTTIFGLMGHSPHFAMLVMSANTGIGM